MISIPSPLGSPGMISPEFHDLSPSALSRSNGPDSLWVFGSSSL
jgi:hypothetical protein